NLWRKEPRSNRRHDDECRDVMEVGNVGAQCEARNLRVVPIDWKRNRRITKHAEVKSIVGVLPDVVAADDKVLAKSLLQSGVKFLLQSGLEISRRIRAGEKRIEHLIEASLAGEHKIFVEWRLQGAC